MKYLSSKLMANVWNRRKAIQLFLLAIFLCPLFVRYLYAQDTQSCNHLNIDIPLRSTLASAGFFANFRNASHSINYQMDQLLEQAQITAKAREQTESACANECKNVVLAVVFDSSPNMVHTDYEEADTCQRLSSATKNNPIVYADRHFDAVEDAKDWYQELTQGRGSDGEDLYRRCPGRCSPSYSSLVFTDQDKVTITTSIVCGHARDKDDDQYRLSAALRWICQDRELIRRDLGSAQ